MLILPSRSLPQKSEPQIPFLINRSPPHYIYLPSTPTLKPPKLSVPHPFILPTMLCTKQVLTKCSVNWCLRARWLPGGCEEAGTIRGQEELRVQVLWSLEMSGKHLKSEKLMEESKVQEVRQGLWDEESRWLKQASQKSVESVALKVKTAQQGWACFQLSAQQGGPRRSVLCSYPESPPACSRSRLTKNNLAPGI